MMYLPFNLDSAYTIHVSKIGNNDNSGFMQRYPPHLARYSKLTIGAAITACPDGGTIIIHPGDYAETVDILAATKKINLIGTHQRKCRIVPTTGNGIKGYAGFTLANISVEPQSTASAVKAIDCEGQDNCQFINCYVACKSYDAIYCPGARNIIIDNCYAFCSYDTIYIGGNGLIRNSVIITDGCYTGGGVARAITTGGAGAGGGHLNIKDCIIIAQPAYGKATGKSPELYQSDRDLYAIHTAVKVALQNCVIVVDGYKPSGAHADSYAKGNAIGLYGIDHITVLNTSIHVRTDQNQATTSAYGLYDVHLAELMNVGLESEGQASTYDFYALASGKQVRATGCKYDSAKVHPNVTVYSVPDSLGRVDIGKIGGSEDSVARLEKATKILANKAIQTKETGKIEYFDDDGVTLILTHTPIDDESTITRTPS